MPKTWTLAQEERALELYRAGQSIGDIGKLIGKTRNSVAGFFSRRGVTSQNRQPEHISARAKARARAAGKKSGFSAPDPGPARAAAAPPWAAPLPVPVRDEPVHAEPAPPPRLQDRRLPEGPPIWRTCQYIAGDPRVDPAKCGEPSRPGSSYCEPHHLRCWQGIPARVRRPE